MSANCSITQVLLRSTQPFSGKSIQSGHCHSFLKTEEQGTFSVDEWLRKCASTAGETSLIPSQGRFYMPQSNSPCAATIEPVLQGLGVATAEARVPQILCSPTREATTVNLHTANREQCTQQRRPRTTENKVVGEKTVYYLKQPKGPKQGIHLVYPNILGCLLW